MKEKKNDEVKELKVEKVEPKKKIITKDRVISVVIGIIIGVIITSCVFCLCIKPHQARSINGPRTQIQNRDRSYMQSRYGRPSKRQKNRPNTNTTENNQEADKTDDNSVQNSN